jgi:two-component sensor histidine kinase
MRPLKSRAKTESDQIVVRLTVSLLATAFAALLLIVGMTIWLGEKARYYLEQSIQVGDTRGYAAGLRNSLLSTESSQRGFLLTGNPIYLAPYDTARTASKIQLEKLAEALASNRSRAKMMLRLNEVVSEILSLSDRMVVLKSDGMETESLALLRTNRSKSLMDEANVFVSAIVNEADERLTGGVIEQNINAARLRLVSILSAILIVILLAAVLSVVRRYMREIGLARSKIEQANEVLEDRVEERTAELASARDRAEILLSEVNHRVSNSLSLVAALVRLQKSTIKDEAAQRALDETHARISAVGLVHQHLYTSNDVREVQVDEYLTALLAQIEKSMMSDGFGVDIKCELAPVRMTTNQTVNLGVIVSEWVTNAVKYAYPQSRGPVRVRMRVADSASVELTVEDDGIGRDEGAGAQGTGLGSRIVSSIAMSIKGQVRYIHRHPGTQAQLTFPHERNRE